MLGLPFLYRDLGWVEFDPTNDLIANEQHIVTGLGTAITPM